MNKEGFTKTVNLMTPNSHIGHAVKMHLFSHFHIDKTLSMN